MCGEVRVCRKSRPDERQEFAFPGPETDHEILDRQEGTSRFSFRKDPVDRFERQSLYGFQSDADRSVLDLEFRRTPVGVRTENPDALSFGLFDIFHDPVVPPAGVEDGGR